MAGAVPAAASLAPQVGEGVGMEREIIAPADASNSDTKSDCRALQCGLLDQRAASRAVAIAAGATPPATSYPLSMFPVHDTSSSGTGPTGDSRLANVGSVGVTWDGTAAEPILF